MHASSVGVRGVPLGGSSTTTTEALNASLTRKNHSIQEIVEASKHKRNTPLMLHLKPFVWQKLYSDIKSIAYGRRREHTCSY